MSHALKAGCIYGAVIFILGIVLGSLREWVLAPVLGRTIVVLLEGPLILLASWWLAGWLIRAWRMPARVGQRLVMGAMAFAVLMAGEAAIAVFGFGRTLLAHLQAYASAKGMLELLPQLAFAMLPLLHMYRDRRMS